MDLIIMGIDPGTVSTGYAVIHTTEDSSKCLDYGLIRANEKSFPLRISKIHQGLKELGQTYKPHHIAVEKIFFGKNPVTAFKLGHIFALCLLESTRQKAEFFEYSTRFIKKAVTFSGNSSKELVQQFVTNFFALSPTPRSLDATDALAVALCHSRECKKNLFQKQIQAVNL